MNWGNDLSLIESNLSVYKNGHVQLPDGCSPMPIVGTMIGYKPLAK
jgi:hypothetical protein